MRPNRIAIQATAAYFNHFNFTTFTFLGGVAVFIKSSFHTSSFDLEKGILISGSEFRKFRSELSLLCWLSFFIYFPNAFRKNERADVILFSTAFTLNSSWSAISLYFRPSILLIRKTTLCFSDKLASAVSYFVCSSL